MQKIFLKVRKFIPAAACIAVTSVLIAFWRTGEEAKLANEALELQLPVNTALTDKETHEKVVSADSNMNRTNILLTDAAEEFMKFGGQGKVADSTLAAATSLNVNTISVDVKGAVKRPGLYKINRDAELGTLIDMAGGLTPEAASEYLNLAQKLEAGSLYRIPSALEIEALLSDAKQLDLLPGLVNVLSREFLVHCGYNTPAATERTEAFEDDDVEVPSVADDADLQNGKINLLNINTCSTAELEAVPGIGGKTAQKIIAYRNRYGSFKNLEDLLNVKGIKRKRLERLSSYLYCG